MAYIADSGTKNPSLTLGSSQVENVAIDEDVSIKTASGDVLAKTMYFKRQPDATAVMEAVTKSPDSIAVNDQIIRSDSFKYYVQSVTPPQVKFGSGTPLLTEKTSISFPEPTLNNFTPEKIATFLIFKK